MATMLDWPNSSGAGLAAGAWVRALLLWAGAGATALLLTAPVLLPSIEYLLRTDRFQVFAQEPLALGACFPASSWPAFLCPRLFGGPDAYHGPLNLILTRTLFTGAVPLLLATAALAAPATRRAGALLAVWGLVHLLAAPRRDRALRRAAPRGPGLARAGARDRRRLGWRWRLSRSPARRRSRPPCRSRSRPRSSWSPCWPGATVSRPLP